MPNFGKLASGVGVGSLVGLVVGGASWAVRSYLGASFALRWWYEPLIAATGGAFAGLAVTLLSKEPEGGKSPLEITLGLLVPALGAAVIPLVDNDKAWLATLMILGLLGCIATAILVNRTTAPADGGTGGKFGAIVTTLIDWEAEYKLTPGEAHGVIKAQMSRFLSKVHRECGEDRSQRDRVAQRYGISPACVDEIWVFVNRSK